jgi:hypothetical protein
LVWRWLPAGAYYNAALCNLALGINFLACFFASSGTMENCKKHDEKFVQTCPAFDGRAGSVGEGINLCCSFCSRFVFLVQGLPVSPSTRRDS